MAEYPDLEIIERELKAEVLERDFIHRKPILRELRADLRIEERPCDNKVLLEARLTTAVFDDTVGAPTTPTICRGNPSGLGAHPI